MSRIPSRWELKPLKISAARFEFTRRIPSRWELKQSLDRLLRRFSIVEFHPVGN